MILAAPVAVVLVEVVAAVAEDSGRPVSEVLDREGEGVPERRRTASVTVGW